MVKGQNSPSQPSMEKPICFKYSPLQQPYLNTQNLISLPIGHTFQIRNCYNHINEPKNKSSPRSLTLLSCKSGEPNVDDDDSSNPMMKKDQKQGLGKQSFLVGFERLGKNLKQNLSPKQKGDWKDLVLMSLSFAVYVYISQKIVCAYCAWKSIINQPW